jgi:hypothetical protein
MQSGAQEKRRDVKRMGKIEHYDDERIRGRRNKSRGQDVPWNTLASDFHSKLAR